MKLHRLDLNAFGEGEGAAAEGMAQPQAAGSASEQGAGTAPARPSFDELVRGEYKQDFQERVEAIINRRLKGSKAELDAVRPVMELLQQRYHIPSGKDMAAAIRQALENDADYWSKAAEKAGMTTEGYRRLLRAEARSKQLEELVGKQQTRQGAVELLRVLDRQAQQVKAQYPDFDPKEELAKNPRFGDLVRRGIDMLTAYQVCHQQEFLAAAQRQTMEKVRENRARPVENGTGGSQPVRLGSDPSKWSREQLREIERRVQRGERIVL